MPGTHIKNMFYSASLTQWHWKRRLITELRGERHCFSSSKHSCSFFLLSCWWLLIVNFRDIRSSKRAIKLFLWIVGLWACGVYLFRYLFLTFFFFKDLISFLERLRIATFFKIRWPNINLKINKVLPVSWGYTRYYDFWSHLAFFFFLILFLWEMKMPYDFRWALLNCKWKLEAL